MCRFTADTHVHTIASGHAYSTVLEIVREAIKKGIQLVAITDHGPKMPDAPHLWHFSNLKSVPREIEGVKVLRGVEANIINFRGDLDMPEEYLKKLDWVIASFHDVCLKPGTVEENTAAFINVMKNPLVDAIGHPGNPQFQVDIERVAGAAKELNKLIEINNHSFYVRTGSEENCREFARTCKVLGTKVCCGSDAHFATSVGSFEKVEGVFRDVEMPQEFIMNVSVERLLNHLKSNHKTLAGFE